MMVFPLVLGGGGLSSYQSLFDKVKDHYPKCLLWREKLRIASTNERYHAASKDFLLIPWNIYVSLHLKHRNGIKG